MFERPAAQSGLPPLRDREAAGQGAPTTWSAYQPGASCGTCAIKGDRIFLRKESRRFAYPLICTSSTAARLGSAASAVSTKLGDYRRRGDRPGQSSGWKAMVPVRAGPIIMHRATVRGLSAAKCETKAHHFAICHHRSKRSARVTAQHGLGAGIGEASPQALVTIFGSIARLKGGHRRQKSPLFYRRGRPRRPRRTLRPDHRGPRGDELMPQGRRESFGKAAVSASSWPFGCPGPGAAPAAKVLKTWVVCGRQSAALITRMVDSGWPPDHGSLAVRNGCAMRADSRRPRFGLARSWPRLPSPRVVAVEPMTRWCAATNRNRRSHPPQGEQTLAEHCRRAQDAVRATADLDTSLSVGA